jgi:uncharacterized coiled-coil protein SlyX
MPNQRIDEMPHQPNELEPDAKRVLGAPSNRKRAVFVVVALLAASAAAAYGWLNYDGTAQSVFAAVQHRPAQPVTSDKETVSREDFQAFQRQAMDSLRSANENLVSQKADLQRLTDQVSALAARLDATQSAVSTTPPQQPAPAPPTVRAARKKPSAPKAGTISVGGSPLPPNPADGH